MDKDNGERIYKIGRNFYIGKAYSDKCKHDILPLTTKKGIFKRQSIIYCKKCGGWEEVSS